MIQYDHPIKIYYKDVDQMGIVYYSRYYEYFEEARTELLASVGLDVTDIEKRDAPNPMTARYLTKCWCVKEAFSKAIASPYLRLDVSYSHIKYKGARFPIVHFVTEPKEWNLKRQDIRISLSDTKEYVVAVCYVWTS